VASPGSSARLFVALDLPDAARSELVAWRERALGGREDLRLVDPEALHVTLVFLGHLPEAEIPRIAAIVRSSAPAGEPPLLRATGVKPLPPRRPRLFALDLADDEGRAGRVQASVSSALEAEGLYKPEQRAFWPHVTLARARHGVRPGMLEAPPPPAGSWQAQAVTLYRSRLSPRGARYERLERVALG
jgi:2'-5' RNA ligase